MKCIKLSLISLLFLLTLLFSLSVFCITPQMIPGSVDPGRVSRVVNAPLKKHQQTLAPVKQTESASQNLGPEAEKIKFKLLKINLKGNTVYSYKQIESLYKDKINTIISIADLQNIVQSITNYYRNNGYVLSRAILPPQHVNHGTVDVLIIEGYIDKVVIVGKPKGAKKIILSYAENIKNSRPLQISILDYYLRLLNEIPGTQVQGVLEPSQTEQGASTLNLAVVEKKFNTYLSYDNYGTRYLGPNQVTFSLNANSWLRSGDSTHFTFLETSRPKNLQFRDFGYDVPFGNHGFRMTVGANDSWTQPGMNLKQVNTEGTSPTYYASFQYPILRSRSQALTLDGGFTYLDSQVTTLGSILYIDHLRPIKFGGVYSFADSFNGSNSASMHIEQGLNILGASNDPTSIYVSRYGADGVFTKIFGQFTRSQLIVGRYSLYGLVGGQYAYSPLLSSEQFGFGGSQVGRGYDPAEIIGDRGAQGSLEFRIDTYPPALLSLLQWYAFYDAGVIWNIKYLPNVQKKQSATSTGFGVRFYFNKYFSGNLMLTQPLTKKVQAEELVGNGSKPRGFFSIVAMI